MSDSHSASGVQPGDVLAGKYRVDRVLGEGGMGIVVAAHHIHLDQKVALKFLLPSALKSPEAVARFLREARTAVKIANEHVARISDVGQLENGAPYIVMEYLEGGDLDGWIKQRGAMPVEQAVEFLLQACVAVADAHALGIVHRDLKPANLFCVRRSDGQLSIKVLDFGISKVTGNAITGPSVAMTKTSAVMGTPLYMSPEQMQSSKAVDARTDIWALGVILYELLTGHAPFVADTVMELAIKIATQPPPPLRAFRLDVPPTLEAVIAKCVEKEPSQRYRNVGELAVALLPFAPKRGKTSVDRISGIIQAAGMSSSALDVPPSPRGDTMHASGGTLLPTGQTTSTGSSRGKSAALGVGVAVLLMLGIGIFVARSRSTSATPHDEPTAAASQPVAAASSVAPPEPPPATTTAPAASASAATATASATPPSLAPSATSSTHASHVVASHGAVPAPPPPPKAAAPNCDPPYMLNAAGHRVHKPECP